MCQCLRRDNLVKRMLYNKIPGVIYMYSILLAETQVKFLDKFTIIFPAPDVVINVNFDVGGVK